MRSETEIDSVFENPDDPQATKERIALLISTLLVGVILGSCAIGLYFSFTGQLCSAHPYCSVHVKEKP